MLKAATPVVWFVNLFVQGAAAGCCASSAASEAGTTLTQEELRSLVLEGQYFRGKHRAMLANLLDLEAVTVDDVMTPRNQIHALDLAAKPSLLAQQLATSYHTRLPAYEGDARQHRRRRPPEAGRAPAARRRDRRRTSCARSCARRISSRPGTPLLAQLQQFQNDRQRLGLVVDEYGELVGPRDDRGHHRGDHRRFHDAGARRRRTPTGAAPTAASSSTAWRRCARSTASSARISRWTARRR